MNRDLKRLALIAMIAAIYTVVSLALAPLTYGGVQVRVAESLTLLPVLSSISIYGVTLGCLITNFIGALTGVNILGMVDVLVGTLATLIAAYLSYRLRKKLWFKQPILAALMPVIINGLVIGLELAYVITPNALWEGWLIFGAQVAVGELIAVVVLGLPLISALKKTKIWQNI